MDPKFKEALDQLHGKYERLISMKPMKAESLPANMPLRGVYLFSLDDKPLYVGRSNNLRRRPLRHCAINATHRMAAFAFKLARKRTGFTKAAYKKGPESRDGLMLNSAFKKAFVQAKAEIRQMDLRFVEEDDPTRQALLEIYCAFAAKAPYNDFDVH